MPDRRGFLMSLSSLPWIGAWIPKVFASARPGRDYFRELGVRPCINAAGTYTMLTASLMPPEVKQAWMYASTRYVRLNELHDAVGKRIAALIGCEAAMVTSGAAGALTLGTAAVLTGTDARKIRQLPDLTGMKSEVIIQKSHRFGYDHAVRNCGIRFVEVETREELERAIHANTAMMLFLNSSNAAGAIRDEEFVQLGRKHGIPTFNDCAADVPPVENLSRYTAMGFDLVAFSGGKGLCGPQSAGLLLGRKDLIEAARLNTSPYADTIGRGMKVNKEEMLAMMVAVEAYLQRDHAADRKEFDRRARVIADAVKGLKGVEVEIRIPPVANHVPHVHIRWSGQSRSIRVADVVEALRAGEPSIEVVPGSREELIVGVWMMQRGDAELVARRIRGILRKAEV